MEDDLESGGGGVRQQMASSSPLKSEQKVTKRSRNDDSATSAMGARLFYFIMYGLFYLSLLLYANRLRDILLLKNGFNLNDFVYLLYYIAVHGLAIYYFLTAGANPGYVSETATENDKKALEMRRLHKQPSGATTEEEDGEDDEEHLGFPIDRKSDVQKRKGSTVDKQAYSKVVLTDLIVDNEQESKSTVEESVNGPKLLISHTDDNVTSIEHVEKVQMPPKRFCEECQVVQPYRSRHCWECNKCVRKFDHHCFWIGGCVGEFNHGKFFLFLLFQTISEISALSLASNGFDQALVAYPDLDNDRDRRQRQHIQTIFTIFFVLLFLFLIFTSILGGYHLYLIVSGQTTWEHASRGNITYMKPYPLGVMPFYMSFSSNLKQVFFNGGKVTDWQLHQPAELKAVQGFNICDNEYYTCC